MDDRPPEQCLFGIANGQSGHFTRQQALTCGYTDEMLAYHGETGRFMRRYHGVYRLRDYPWSNRDDIMAAWLAVGRETTVVSHESALEIAELSDVIPHWFHLTVPRGKQIRRTLPGVKIHTTTREFGSRDIVMRDGMRVTSVARTIVDCAETGTGPEQIEMAVQQVIERAQTTPQRLRDAAANRSTRVRRQIERLLEMMRS